METTMLTIEKANQLIGKEIKWRAPQSDDNGGYYGGTCIILSVNPEERRLIKSTTISGDDLDFAYVQNTKLIPFELGFRMEESHGDDRVLTYSDDDRIVEVIDII